MGKDIMSIDDGMLHQAFITDKLLIVVKNHRKPLLLSESKKLTGYVEVEDERVVNEGGLQFGQQLKEFHGKIVVI